MQVYLFCDSHMKGRRSRDLRKLEPADIQRLFKLVLLHFTQKPNLMHCYGWSTLHFNCCHEFLDVFFSILLERIEGSSSQVT
jgi:hypothetical protein